MKAKYFIMVSLILVVFTISAVCASQDVIEDNNITAIDETEDSVSESPVEKILATEENKEILEAEPTDFKVNITKEINVSEQNWENKNLATVYCSERAEGVSMIITQPGGSNQVIGSLSSPFNIDAGETVNVTCGNFIMVFNRYIGNFDVVVKYNDSAIVRETITITKNINIEDFQYNSFDSDYQNSYEYVIQFTPKVSGNLTVFVNGAERHNKYYEGRTQMFGSQVYINKSELSLATPGEYRILAKYSTEDYGTCDFGEFSYLVGEEYVKFIASEIDLNREEMYSGIYPIKPIAIIEDSESINGTVTVIIDGKESYRKSFSDSTTELEIQSDDLNLTGIALGNHTFKVTYNRNNADEHSLERTALIYETPNVHNPSFMFEGEKEAVIVTANKNYTGTIILFNPIYSPMSPDNEVIGSANITDGIARISMENLTTGRYPFILKSFIDQLPAMSSLIIPVNIIVKDNPAGYESNISSTAINPEGEVTVTLKGNVSNERVYLFVDGISYTNITFSDDVATSTIRDLAIGRHYITIKRYNPRDFENEDSYSNTFVVDVVEPVDPNLSIIVNDTVKGNGAVVEIFANKTLTGTVNVRLNNSATVYPVDVVEGYGIKTISSLDVGTYLASATFDGNAYFEPSVKSTTFNVEDFIITIAEKIDLDDENIENIPIVSIYCPKGAKGTNVYFDIYSQATYVDSLKINLKENLGKTVNVTIKDSLQGLKNMGCGTFTIKALVDWETEIGSGPINITRMITNDNFEFVTYSESELNWVIDFRSSPVNGNLTVSVNGTERYNEYLKKYESPATITSQDLGIDRPGEENEISVRFISEDGATYDLAEFDYFQCSEHILIRDIDSYNNNMEIVKIMDFEVKGNITILFDGKTIFNGHFDEYGEVKILPFLLDFGNITYGTHKLFVNYTKDNNENYTLERNVLVYETPKYDCPDFIIEGEKAVIIITAQKEYTGKVNLTLNQGVKKLLCTTDLVDGNAIITLENLVKGDYDLIYTCVIDQIPNKILGRGFTLSVKEKSDNFRVEINATTINLGDCIKATFYSEISNLNGTVSSFINGERYRSVDLTPQGKADIIFGNLTSGDNYLRFEFVDTTGRYYYSDTILVKVINKTDVKIDPNLRITVKSVHKSEKPVIEIRTDAQLTGKVTVKIGTKTYVINVVNGKGTKTIPSLKVGSYTAKAIFAGNDMFNSSEKSVTFKVTKDVIKLTLKKVKVKKSAKKLKITATLKINGKKVKGKKLTFKFNKKTYKAKTNKKGLAKITITKKVLKKLKVGKKVKYQVSYSGKTVKRTVKIKR